MKRNTCISCKYYDGIYCTAMLNNLDYDYAEEEMFRAPFDTCDDYEEDLEMEDAE